MEEGCGEVGEEGSGKVGEEDGLGGEGVEVVGVGGGEERVAGGEEEWQHVGTLNVEREADDGEKRDGGEGGEVCRGEGLRFGCKGDGGKGCEEDCGGGPRVQVVAEGLVEAGVDEKESEREKKEDEDQDVERAWLGEAVRAAGESACWKAGRKEEGGDDGAEDEGEGEEQELLAGGGVGEAEAIQLEVEEEEEEGEEGDAEIGCGGRLGCFHLLLSPGCWKACCRAPVVAEVQLSVAQGLPWNFPGRGVCK